MSGYIITFLAGAGAMFLLVTFNTGRPKKKNKTTYIKLITSLVVGHGMILTTMSYVLSYYEKEPVCEVSVVLITEIIAPVITYAVTKTLENIFEKNKLIFSEPIDSINEKMEDTENE